MTLSHVKQRKRVDCVVATVANILKLRYETVACSAPGNGATTVSFKQAQRLLQELSGDRWQRQELIDYRMPLDEVAPQLPAEPCLVLIYRPGGENSTSHAIAVHVDKVQDPSWSRPCRVAAYRKRHWHVAGVVFMGVHDPSGARRFRGVVREKRRSRFRSMLARIRG